MPEFGYPIGFFCIPVLMLSDSQQIRVSSVVVSLISFALFVVVDVWWSKDVTDMGTLVAIGGLGLVWSGPLTSLAGTRAYKTFRWWQPFEGGVIFVFLQAFGWAVYGLCVLFSFIAFFNVSQSHLKGLYSGLGFMGFTAQILLNVSIGTSCMLFPSTFYTIQNVGLFQEHEGRVRAESWDGFQSLHPAAQRGRPFRLWNAKVCIINLLTILSHLISRFCFTWYVGGNGCPLFPRIGHIARRSGLVARQPRCMPRSAPFDVTSRVRMYHHPCLQRPQRAARLQTGTAVRGRDHIRIVAGLLLDLPGHGHTVLHVAPCTEHRWRIGTHTN